MAVSMPDITADEGSVQSELGCQRGAGIGGDVSNNHACALFDQPPCRCGADTCVRHAYISRKRPSEPAA